MRVPASPTTLPKSVRRAIAARLRDCAYPLWGTRQRAMAMKADERTGHEFRGVPTHDLACRRGGRSCACNPTPRDGRSGTIRCDSYSVHMSQPAPPRCCGKAVSRRCARTPGSRSSMAYVPFIQEDVFEAIIRSCRESVVPEVCESRLTWAQAIKLRPHGSPMGDHGRRRGVSSACATLQGEQ